MTEAPEYRTQRCNDRGENPHGDYVLYWMIANRRTGWNFSFQRAVEWSRTFDRPLIVLEALRCGYQWASDRIHRFVIEGMQDNAVRLANSGVFYYPYVESRPGEGQGLLPELAKRACVVVTDDFPSFFLPRMVAAAACQLGILLEKVDSNGIFPIRLTQKAFLTALSFRRFLQNNVEPHLHFFPEPDPLAGGIRSFDGKLADGILERWPLALETIESGNEMGLASLPIDHSVQPSSTRGGSQAANNLLASFLNERLAKYADSRNHPDDDGGSALSPYLHFGHISSHHVFHALTEIEKWSKSRIWGGGRGQREGWWGMSRDAESFLDQIITWRELGYNMCVHSPIYDQYGSLPRWAKETLEVHADDPRSHLYSLDRLECAGTHDPLWNAAQTQLKREGRLHNYLRMLWGKKILEWTRTPQDALDLMIHFNNKYALDGRNPNSYTGIFWVLGRYDRPWAPERPIFGKIRYMSSESARRKIRLKDYLRTYSQ